MEFGIGNERAQVAHERLYEEKEVLTFGKNS